MRPFERPASDDVFLNQMEVSSVKVLLRFAALTLLLVVLFLSSAAGEVKAQPRIEITPKELVISGIIDTSPFQHPFTIRAVNGDITELSFSPVNLMEISAGKSWITGADVQITPAATRIKKGQSQDFIVTVQNIPQSGQYNGTIAVTYKEQAVDAQDTLSVSVRAAKFTTIPPQIVLRFEKSLFGLGGTGDVPWTLALNEDTGRASQEMIGSLAETTSVSLDPLVHSEDKSQVIRPGQIFAQPVTLDTQSGRRGLAIKITFSNPQVGAGKYMGNLAVRSDGLGLLANVPVEVQVRYTSRLAWLLIVAGIVASLLVGWWNTTGKKRNAIWGKILDRQDKLSKSDITDVCRAQLQGLLDDARGHLRDDELEDAEGKVNQFDGDLQTCARNVKELRKTAAEVQGLIDGFEDKVMEPVREIVDDSDDSAPVLRNELPRLKEALKTLKQDIDRGIYQSLDDVLKRKVADLSNQVQGVIDLIDKLREYERQVQYYQQPPPQRGGFKMEKAENALKKCKRYLASGAIDTAKECLGPIKTAIDEDLEGEGSKRIQDHVSPNFADAPRVPDPLSRSTRMVSILSDVLHAGNLNEEDEMRLRATRKSLETHVENLRREAEEISPPPPPSPPPQPNVLDRFRKWWRQWWTPERQERAVSIVLFLLAIPILAVIGFSQLYANKPTFGATNVWEEYLGLFLWGFGIQTGTATVAGVLRTFRGS